MAATTTIERPTTLAPPAQMFALTGISWETYEALLSDYLDRSVPHFTYDHGVLEIMAPSLPHEKDNRLLALLVEVVAEELAIDVSNVGSMTFTRRDLDRGFEPDTGFYIQHEAIVREAREINLVTDPPPDLLIEVEVSNSVLPKLPIFAAIGVPEVWRIGAERVRILVLDNGDYAASDRSTALPPLTADALSRFLSRGRSLPRTAWLREVRGWVRAQPPPDQPPS